jgi:hypothetical protein
MCEGRNAVSGRRQVEVTEQSLTESFESVAVHCSYWRRSLQEWHEAELGISAQSWIDRTTVASNCAMRGLKFNKKIVSVRERVV